MNDVAIIVIGRNEGERLERCLKSCAGKASQIIYVDSNSTDGSVELAKSLGATVVSLDMSLPFSAARARNAGFEKVDPTTPYVQFLDGDCELDANWIKRAKRELESDAQLAVVCGRRRERFPDRSIYNRITDLEWNTPVGPAKSCGGDSLMRAEMFRAVGGFDASVVAGEEPELCQRLRGKGWKIVRIDAEMTIHDANITRLSQWWKRAVRGGYGALDVFTRFGSEGLFASQVRSARFWTLGWIAGMYVAALLVSLLLFYFHSIWIPLVSIPLLLFILLLPPAQIVRLALRKRHQTQRFSDAAAWAFLTMFSKWANLAGQFQYRRDRRNGRGGRLIEYKNDAPQAAAAAHA